MSACQIWVATRVLHLSVILRSLRLHVELSLARSTKSITPELQETPTHCQPSLRKTTEEFGVGDAAPRSGIDKRVEVPNVNFERMKTRFSPKINEERFLPVPSPFKRQLMNRIWNLKPFTGIISLKHNCRLDAL
jgi:hypothetical protein